ncbi:GNAT family N-acetyltransferase [Paenibacillus sepulcri]|uniref:GNAT family N-acetyltransferase n=1 Tax=Paenibacillus sepulcri TaxID=359917 RepID=A0ABS7C4K7_9BACL|nr:GNAT family N-acetyltransferase [Paenibacillus sepulcri]
MITSADLNHPLWPEALRIYHGAFAQEGRKSDAVIKRMFDKHLCFLHIGSINQEAAAMAISARSDDGRVLVIDYLAVREDLRGQGTGADFVRAISRWTQEEQALEGIVIEAEADETAVNASRIRFWEKCGFTLTDYVHHYRWVPEPYRAMFNWFEPGSGLPVDGEALFRYIISFHQKAYAK